MLQPTRPHGRSLGDFRDQKTESGLLPAEDKLLAAVAQGQICELGSHNVPEQLYEEISTRDTSSLISDAFAFSRGIYSNDIKNEEGKQIPPKIEVDATNSSIHGLARLCLKVLKYCKDILSTLELSSWRSRLNQKAKQNNSSALEQAPEGQLRFLDDYARGLNDIKNTASIYSNDTKSVTHQWKKPFKSKPSYWRPSYWQQVDPNDATVRVRTSFLRFLLLGGDESAPVHESGVQLSGAFIQGDFNLEDIDVNYPIVLKNCWIEGKIAMRRSRFCVLDMEGSYINSIEAVRAIFTSSVYLPYGFRAGGEVNLMGAQIGGNLECIDGTFQNLNCANTNIAGSVLLNQTFRARGDVDFSDAQIGGNLECADGTFQNLNCSGAKISGNLGCASCTFKNLNCSGVEIGKNVSIGVGVRVDGIIDFHSALIGNTLSFKNGTATGQGEIDNLLCDGAKIMGSVWFTEGFRVVGRARFVSAHVGRSFYCTSGSFGNAIPKSTNLTVGTTHSGVADTVLDLSGININGALLIGPGEEGEISSSQVDFRGAVNLSGARVGHFSDHPGSWPPAYVKGPDGKMLSCYVELDGFCYGRLYALAPIDPYTRMKWLQRQPREHLADNGFKPQPFEQLISVMRAMGHAKEAREIAIFKQKCLARASTQRASWWKRPFVWVLWFLYGTVVGYGYKPHRVVISMFALWLGSALFYQVAAEHKIFAPTEGTVVLDNRFKSCRPPAGNWTECRQIQEAEFQEYTSFNPWAYSLDAILPVVDLYQEQAWQPMSRKMTLEYGKLGSVELPPDITRGLVWVEIIVGWAGSLFLIASITGVIKSA